MGTTSVDGGGRDADVAALVALLAQEEATAPAGDRATLRRLRREVRGIDDGCGLPEALIHPDTSGDVAQSDASKRAMPPWLACEVEGTPE